MILQSAKDYLSQTNSIRVAHLVEIELAGTDGTFEYITDYMSNITYDGKIFTAGKITAVGAPVFTQGLKNYQLTVSVAGEFQEELDKGTSDSSFEGRRINIYKAFLDSSGAIIPFESTTNGPMILFKGKISRINISEDITKGSSTVSWSCVGLLADFEKVNGRLTEDASHRGLVSGGINNLPIPSSGAKKEAYKTDTGFQHANQTVAANIKYLSKEKEYYLKKSWGGLKTKLREREVEVEREVEISTSLSSKYLPVVYGVRRVTGIPVFMDVLKNDPSTVFVVYAVCEGEIESFLNVYVDGVSAICGDVTESNTSGVCMGNMAAGDTLSLYTNAGAGGTNTQYRLGRWVGYKYDRDGVAGDYYQSASPATSNEVGTSHGDTINIAAEKGAVQMTFYHGKPDQTPDSVLVGHAAANNFMIQGLTKKLDGTAWGPEYWQGASVGVSGAALLDTAYVVARFKMSEQRDSIPTIDFVVSGKKCPVYTTPNTFTYEYTLNPVWHLLDYLTSDIYGAGLALSDLDIASLIDTAARLDVQDTSYSTEFITYWRYIGWLNDTYSRAMMQCNTLINTEESVTKVVESLLDQFDGTLATLDGINTMSIENDDAPVASIDIGEVIGSVTLEERPNKDKWNSLNASIVDPGMNWSTNQINFFNSTFLAEDNNIRKKGRAVFSYITNYYTARAWAERQLNKSRFGRTVRFTTYYKYLFLRPNDNVTFTYPRFGYNNAKFRVSSVEPSADGKVRLTLQRYESSIYNVTDQPKVENPSVGGDPVGLPTGLGYVILPSGLVNITPETEGVPYALIYWDISTATNLLRYEMLTTQDPGYVVQALPTDIIAVGGQNKNYALYPIQPLTEYTVKVQAITKEGARSAYSVISFTTGASVTPTVIPAVEDFIVTNLAPDGTFTGPTLNLQWTALSADEADTYSIDFIDPNTSTVIYTASIAQANNTYTFALATNISAYATFNGGDIGAYRNLTPRIRAIKNGYFSEWSNITNGI